MVIHEPEGRKATYVVRGRAINELLPKVFCSDETQGQDWWMIKQ